MRTRHDESVTVCDTVYLCVVVTVTVIEFVKAGVPLSDAVGATVCRCDGVSNVVAVSVGVFDTVTLTEGTESELSVSL